jgi:hypothetical protein
MAFRKKNKSNELYEQFFAGFFELTDFKLLVARDLIKAASKNMYPPEYSAALEAVMEFRGLKE